MDLRETKRVTKLYLEELALPYDKITARTVSFCDLARGSCIFVTIHGWTPNSYGEEIRFFAKRNGFRILFKGKGFI